MRPAARMMVESWMPGRRSSGQPSVCDSGLPLQHCLPVRLAALNGAEWPTLAQSHNSWRRGMAAAISPPASAPAVASGSLGPLPLTLVSYPMSRFLRCSCHSRCSLARTSNGQCWGLFSCYAMSPLRFASRHAPPRHVGNQQHAMDVLACANTLSSVTGRSFVQLYGHQKSNAAMEAPYRDAKRQAKSRGNKRQRRDLAMSALHGPGCAQPACSSGACALSGGELGG